MILVILLNFDRNFLFLAKYFIKNYIDDLHCQKNLNQTQKFILTTKIDTFLHVKHRFFSI
jgi:hypothetical protein